MFSVAFLFKLRFSGEILRARRTGMEVTKAFPVLLDLLVTSPGSARLHELRPRSAWAQHGLSMGSALNCAWSAQAMLSMGSA